MGRRSVLRGFATFAAVGTEECGLEVLLKAGSGRLLIAACTLLLRRCLRGNGPEQKRNNGWRRRGSGHYASRSDRNKPILGWRRTEADKFVERGFEKLVPFGNGLFGRELNGTFLGLTILGIFLAFFSTINEEEGTGLSEWLMFFSPADFQFQFGVNLHKVMD